MLWRFCLSWSYILRFCLFMCCPSAMPLSGSCVRFLCRMFVWDLFVRCLCNDWMALIGWHQLNCIFYRIILARWEMGFTGITRLEYLDCSVLNGVSRLKCFDWGASTGLPRLECLNSSASTGVLWAYCFDWGVLTGVSWLDVAFCALLLCAVLVKCLCLGLLAIAFNWCPF